MMSAKTTERIGGVVVFFIAILGVMLIPLFQPVSCAPAVATCSISTGAIGSGLSNPTQTASTMDEAVSIAQSYLKALNNPNLAIDKVIEFQKNFEVIYYEKGSGIGAFTITISKPGTGPLPLDPSGYMLPEEGPNSMWNTKYGLADFAARQYSNGIIDMNMAKATAQGYLDQYIPGAKVGDEHPFYGFYSFEVIKDGKVYGMLSVNSRVLQVLYHDWQSDYVQTRELSNDWNY